MGSSDFEDDFLTIYDGPNDQSIEIKKLKGDLGSFNIASTGNSLFVKLESDPYTDNQNLGFLSTIHYSNPFLNTTLAPIEGSYSNSRPSSKI